VTVFIYSPSGERVARLDSFDAPIVTWQPDPRLANGVYLYQVQRVPEAASPSPNTAPTGVDLQSVFGKIALIR
jgi:hypothetical protein